MSRARLIVLTSLAMIAFAGNSLLCRVALRETDLDAASFTAIRLASGAFMLGIVVRMRRGASLDPAGWPYNFDPQAVSITGTPQEEPVPVR